MGETAKELCRNRITHEKELEIFKRETLKKIEVFRGERSKWLGSNRQEVNGSPEHGLNDSDLYKGRCLILRKLGFRTNRLISHYKTLRPLKCYTLKMKPRTEETDTKSQMSVATAADVAPGNGVTKVFAHRSPRTNLWKRAQTRVLHSRIENDGERNPVPKTDIEKEEREPLGADSEKKRSVWKWRRNKDKPKEKKKKGPSRRAIENLKAAAQANRLIESCRCRDGKEVTVVIKGFCPCDKLNLNQLKLDKLRNEYRKSQVLETAPAPAPARPTSAVPEKASASHLEIRNSLKIQRKRTGGNGEVGEKPSDSSLTSKKSVRFRGEEPLEKKIASMVTLFRNGEREGSTMALTRDQYEKMKQSSSAKGGC